MAYEIVETLTTWIGLAKDGRVQFALGNDPAEYASSDFLAPIFEEFRPPLINSVPVIFFDTQENIVNRIIEFDTIAQINLIPDLGRHGYSDGSIRRMIETFGADYAILKAFGYHELADEALNLTLTDVESAFYLYGVIGGLVTDPAKSRLGILHKVIDTIDSEFLKISLHKARKHFRDFSTEFGRLTLPYEIGKFLVTKLTYLPEGYDACVSLMDRYKQEDLYSLTTALQVGCESSDVDVVNSKSKELSIVFDNVWKDANQISRLSKEIEYGFTFSLGLIGALATLPIGGVGGVLTSLGFRVVNRVFGPTLSERLAKIASSNHLVAIHDFKRKYRIN